MFKWMIEQENYVKICTLLIFYATAINLTNKL